MQLFKCEVCGYLAEEFIPDNCPRCGAPKEKFTVVESELMEKILRSRLSNDLHVEIMRIADKMLAISEKGIEDNLDPTCVTIFNYCKKQSIIIKQLSKAEINGHIGKQKWG